MTKTPDENLKKYATEPQWEAYLAIHETGSQRKAAEKLGIAKSSLQDRLNGMLRAAARQGYAPPMLTHPVPDGLTLKGTSQLLNAEGGIDAQWIKTKVDGRDPAEVVQLPDPKKIVKLSTLYDQAGKVSQQWVSEKPQDAEREKLWTVFAETLAKGISPAKPVDTSLGLSHQDLLAVYPVGDHHTGMLAWAKESGEAWDLKIAEEMLQKATRKLIDTCPPCEQALVAFLGDLFHTDSYASVTPAHKHLLDSDSRYPKMIEIGAMMIEYVILAALEKHQSVRVIFEKGNHDESTVAAIAVFFKRLYRDEPRVFIDDSPAFFHYYKFGKVLLGTNHGDKVKMEKQLAVMAHDRAEDWGATTYRMMMNGHVHTEHRREFPGGWVETFGVLPPQDAYAHRGGYRSIQQMHALVFHRDGYLLDRHMVYPGMFASEGAK